MKGIKINIYLLLFFLCAISSNNILAQSTLEKSINQATLIGIGKSFITESYLSPLPYNGLYVSLLNDRLSPTLWANEKILLQQLFQIEVAFTNNLNASATEYFGNVSYTTTAYYPIATHQDFRLFAGSGLSASLGGIYNLRNSNNPGSLKTAININFALMAVYNLKWLTLRWQITSPMLGAFFSPTYGQSYYEIFSLGNDKGTIQLGTFANQVGFKNYVTADIPLGNVTIRTGYLGDYYKTVANNLNSKIISHQLLIGLAFESLNIGGKKAKNNSITQSSFY